LTVIISRADSLVFQQPASLRSGNPTNGSWWFVQINKRNRREMAGAVSRRGFLPAFY
jgi:hypothetical protein